MPKKKGKKGKKKKIKIDQVAVKKKFKDFVSKYNANCLRLDAVPCKALVNKVKGLAKEEKLTSDKFDVVLDAECDIKGLRALIDALNGFDGYENISFWKSTLGDEGAELLGAFIKPNCFMKKLDLLDNRIGTNGANAIAQSLHHNEHLTHLTLDYNDIRDEGASVLAVGVSWNPALQFLSLNYCNIGGEGGEVIGTEIVGKARGLQELSLKGNPLGAKGVMAIGEGLKNATVLKKLCIADTNFGHSTKAVQTLGEALTVNTTLTNLDMSLNALNPEAVPAFLEMLKQNKTLTKLKVYELKMSKDTFKEFKAAVAGNGKKKKKGKKGKKGKKKKK